jgi:hypothetical protein
MFPEIQRKERAAELVKAQRSMNVNRLFPESALNVP